MGLVGVALDALIDVVYKEPIPRQSLIIQAALAVFDQEVLTAWRAGFPQVVNGVPVLNIGDIDGVVGCRFADRNPVLVDFAPSGWVRGYVAATVPTAARHQAPVAEPARGVVCVVEIGPPEQEVA